MNIFKTSTIGLLLAASLFGQAHTAQRTIALSSTPTAVNCTTTNRYVSSATFRVVPGGGEKALIGTSTTMNSVTFAGVAAILYPNSGAASEQFHLQSRQGDQIDLCALYTVGQYAGDIVLLDIEYNNATYTTAPSPLLTAQQVGPIDTSHPIITSGYALQYIRVQVVPGATQKVQVSYDGSGASGLSSELYPNAGTLSQHNAWSEMWELTASPLGPGFLSSTYLHVTPGAGESALISTWTTTTSSTANDRTISSRQSVSNVPKQLFPSGIPTASGGTSYNGQVTVKMVPGYGFKVAVGTLVGGVFQTMKVLYPNSAGGWSEPFHMEGSQGGYDVRSIYAESFSGVVSIDTMAQPLPGGFQGTPSITAKSVTWLTTPVAIGMGNVHSLKLSVVPGQTGKVYVGTATMNTSTLAGVVAILYPNSTGRWSEEYNIADTVSNLAGYDYDGIDTASLYVVGANSGEGVNIAAYAAGIANSTGLTLKFAGPVRNTTSLPSLLSSTSVAVSNLRVQTIPGQAGKSFIGNAAMTGISQPDYSFTDELKVLWPNTGNFNVNEGHSEHFVVDCAYNGNSKNCADLNGFSLWSAISGEGVLVSAWGR